MKRIPWMICLGIILMGVLWLPAGCVQRDADMHSLVSPHGAASPLATRPVLEAYKDFGPLFANEAEILQADFTFDVPAGFRIAEIRNPLRCCSSYQAKLDSSGKKLAAAMAWQGKGRLGAQHWVGEIFPVDPAHPGIVLEGKAELLTPLAVVIHQPPGGIRFKAGTREEVPIEIQIHRRLAEASADRSLELRLCNVSPEFSLRMSPAVHQRLGPSLLRSTLVAKLVISGALPPGIHVRRLSFTAGTADLSGTVNFHFEVLPAIQVEPTALLIRQNGLGVSRLRLSAEDKQSIRLVAVQCPPTIAVTPAGSADGDFLLDVALTLAGKEMVHGATARTQTLRLETDRGTLEVPVHDLRRAARAAASTKEAAQ